MSCQTNYDLGFFEIMKFYENLQISGRNSLVPNLCQKRKPENVVIKLKQINY